MDAGDRQRNFRLGDWLVEPRLGRITGDGQSHPLAFHHVRILQMLAARHGEVVDRQALRDHAWPCQHTTDEMLRVAVRELRQLLGDPVRDPRYILSVAHRGYALIARFEPLAEPGFEVPTFPAATLAVGSPLIVRAQKLVSELRRRQVFKVLGAYLVGMWIILQVAETTFEPLHLPGWWLTALTILAVIGIPIVGMLVWSYEITAGGIVLDAADRARVKLPHARRAVAPLLVAGVALMAGVTGLAWWRSIADVSKPAVATAEPAPQSIAVLPLVDMTPGGGSAYLGDGFSEELSAQLARVPGLRVASRTSAFAFKGKRVDVRRIGEALGVRNVLEGSVRRDGDKLRVTVQLIDTRSGYHVWSDSYDRTWADVIVIQDEISRSITRKLAVVLTPEAERKLKRGGVANLAAYDHYLAGVAAMHESGDLSQLQKAGELFRKALALDPAFSRAYAGLCEAGIARYDRTGAATDVAEAEADCRKALELDPSRDETELALGRLYRVSGRSEQAEAVYRGLVARRPRDADVYIGLGWALDGQEQRDAAEASFRKAIEVEPGYSGAYTALGGFLFDAGRTEEAVGAYTRATEMVPGSASAFNNLGAALLASVRLQDAARAFERSLAIAPTRSAHGNLGTLYYFLGQFPEAVRHYESAQALASQDHKVLGELADALWQIDGRRPEAVELYQRAAGLAEASLKVNPLDAVVWAQLAYYSGRAGDQQHAVRAQARAEALGEGEMYVQYYVALTEADRNNTAAAAAAIERAEKLGYSRRLLDVDPVLKPVLRRGKS